MARTNQDIQDDIYEAEERCAALWDTARNGVWTPELGVSYGVWADQYNTAVLEGIERRRQGRERAQREAAVSKLIRGL